MCTLQGSWTNSVPDNIDMLAHVGSMLTVHIHFVGPTSAILSFFIFILPYALVDILGRLAQCLLVQDSKKGKNYSTEV